MSSSTYVRIALVTLVVMAVAAVPMIWGSNRGVATMFNVPLLLMVPDSCQAELGPRRRPQAGAWG